MARFGPLEWIGAAGSVALLALGARQLQEDLRFRAGARALDTEVAEVLLGPDQRSFSYVVRATDQGRALKLTLPGAESSRGAPRAANRVGDRLRVLYNPAEQPQARWERHAWNDSVIYLVLGAGLALITLAANLLERWAASRRRPAVPARPAVGRRPLARK